MLLKFRNTLGINRVPGPYVFIGMRTALQPYEFIGFLKIMILTSRFVKIPNTLGISRVPGPYVFIGMKKLCNPMSS